MARHLFKFFFYIIIGILIWSCNPYYHPTVVNAPVITQKNDGELGIQRSVTSGLDIQASYSPFENIAVTGNYSTDKYNSSKQNHSMLEGAVGGYKSIDQYDYDLVLNGFLGYGRGYVRKQTKKYYRKYFFQPSFGVTSKVIDGNLGTRLVLVDYEDITSNSFRWNSEKYDFFLEPFYTQRFGYKFLKLQYQIGFVFPLGDVQRDAYFPLMYSFGIHFNFAQKYLCKESKEKKDF